MSRNKFRSRLFMAWLAVLAGLLLVVFVITVLATITSVTITSPTSTSPAYSKAGITFTVQYQGVGDELVQARHYLTSAATGAPWGPVARYTDTVQLPATRNVILDVPSTAPDGVYTVTVELERFGGGTTVYYTQGSSVILDSVMPTVSIDAISSCVSTLSQVTGVMTDFTSGVPWVKTKIRNSDLYWWNGTTSTWDTGAEIWNTAVGTATAASSESWSYALPSLVHNKFYTMTANAMDGATNEISTSHRFTSSFQVDTAIPTVVFTNPPSSWVNPTMVITLTGAVTDTTGCGNTLITPYANAWVELYNATGVRWWDGTTSGGQWLGASVWNTKTLGTAFSWTYTMPTLTNGREYQVTAKGADTAGNYSAESATSTFNYDAISPTVASGWPVTGTYYTTATVPTTIFTGTASDAGYTASPQTGSGVNKVQLMLNRDSEYWNGAAWVAATWFTATGTNDWTWTLSTTVTYTDSKPYTLTAKVTDNAGNVPTDYYTSTFYYDANAPTVYITPTTIVTCGITSVGGTASDTFSGLDKDEVYVKIKDNTDSDWWNGSIWSTETQLTALTGARVTAHGWVTTSWAYTVTSAMLENGHSYTAWAQSQDNAGNQSTWLSRTFSYDACPTVDFTAPGAGVMLSALSAFTGTAGDTSPGTVQTVTVKVECSTGGTLQDWTSATDDSAGGTWSNWHYTYGFAQTGVYTLSARAQDNVPTAAVVTRTLIYDTDAPTVTIGSIGGQPTGFTGIVSDVMAGPDWVTIVITNASSQCWTGSAWGAGTTWLTATLSSPWAYTMTWSYNADDVTFQGGQTYTVTAKAQDRAGTARDFTRSFTYGDSSSISLGGGWNLMSLPLIPNDTAIATVMSGLSVDWVDTFVWVGGVLTEKKWDPPVEELTTMTTGQGYWAKMLSAGTLTNAGIFQPNPPDTPKSYSVYAGWNMIGYHTTLASRLTSPVSVTAYLRPSVATATRAMYYYEGGAYQAVTTPDSELMKVGFGYWLALDATGTITAYTIYP